MYSFDITLIMKRLSVVVLCLFPSYWTMCCGEALELTRESSCGETTQFYQLYAEPITVLWRHNFLHGCRLFFLPASTEYRVCFTIRDLNVRTDSRRIYISYLQGYDVFPLQTFNSKSSVNMATCGERGSKMIVMLEATDDHVDRNSSIRFTIFQEDNNYVKITNDCYLGYSTLAYVIDQQSINVQWTVNDVSSCQLHFRPSSIRSRICITMEDITLKRGTRIFIKYPVTGERISLKTIDYKSTTGEKICVFSGTTLMVRFSNAYTLPTGQNSSSTMYVFEEKIGYNEADPLIQVPIPVWILIFTLSTMFMLMIVMYVSITQCKGKQEEEKEETNSKDDKDTEIASALWIADDYY